MIKNQIMSQLNQYLIDQGISCKILGSNFDEINSNRPQSNCEIHVFYRGSDRANTGNNNSKNTVSYRNYNFEIELIHKNLRQEDITQDLVDIIWNALDSVIINNHKLILVSDSFVEFENGFWRYSFTTYITFVNTTDTVECTTELIQSVRILISPSTEKPVEYDPALSTEVATFQTNQ